MANEMKYFDGPMNKRLGLESEARAKMEKRKSLPVKLIRNVFIAGTLGGLGFLTFNHINENYVNPIKVDENTSWYSVPETNTWKAYMGEKTPKNIFAWSDYQAFTKQKQKELKDNSIYPDLDNDGYVAGIKVSN